MEEAFPLSTRQSSRVVNERARFVVKKEPVPSARALRWSSSPLESSAQRHRCFLARNGIYFGLGALGIGKGDRVLVPAYICRAAVDPVLARDVEVDFYRVGGRCEVDLDDIASRLRTRTRALMVVHYFGFPQDMAAVTAFCRRHELYLIEDCAHVFGGIPGLTLGTYGDVSVFSWRKFLPLFDGGDLLINADVPFSPAWQDESVLFTLKVAKRMFDAWAADRWWFDSIDRVLETMKKSLLSTPATSVPGGALQVETASLDFDVDLVGLPMSRLSRWMLAHTRATWVIERRRDNYRHLGKLLDPAKTESLFSDLPDGTCPWVYPVFIGSRPNAHLELRARGIPAVTWGGVRPPGLGVAEYPLTDRLYENLVFLPVHQDLDISALERIAEVVHAVADRASRTTSASGARA